MFFSSSYLPLEFQILGRKSKNHNNSYDSNNSNDIFSCIEKINNEQKKIVDKTPDYKNKNNGNNGNNFYCLHLQMRFQFAKIQECSLKGLEQSVD